ncbi:cupin domain-containing protein [Luteolibacter sp. LG18]|uniref:cupin domain-containing protein n=1 Tax=Luteolibacter sp. LG18 TaxID=2819286 RepID=UPI002B281174|nr:hypothetical protein llg_34550 [Luteolibacter sp. LG18]
MKTALVSLAAFTLASPLFAAGPDAEKAYSKTIAVTPLMKTRVDAAGQPITWPAYPAEVSAVRVVIPPGAETGWHRHPVPCFAYILEGELDVKLETGETKHLKGGQAFAETVNVMHNGRNNSKRPVVLVMFAAGTADEPYAVKQPAAQTKTGARPHGPRRF